MPFRVALSLFTLLVFATPALAQQDQLTGTWRFRSFAGITGRGGICASGTVTFNGEGAVTAGSLQECNPAVPVMPLVGGSLTVGADGSLTGGVDIFGLEGNFLPGGDAFVAVSTITTTGPAGFGLGVFVKDTATTFTQSDLAGTWRIRLVQGGELPTEISEIALGSIVVGPTGTVTGGFLTARSQDLGTSFQEIVGGSIGIDADGVMSGTILSTEDGGSPNTTTFSGLMATDKKLVAGAIRTDDGEHAASGLVLLQRQLAPIPLYTVGDLAGTWAFNNVILHPATAEEAFWVRGTLTLDAGGIVTAGTLTTSTGFSGSPVGAFAVDSIGFVAGAFTLGDVGFAFDGTMFDAKNHVIATDLLFVAGDIETPAGPAGVGVFSMARQGAAAAPAVVQFSAPTYTVTEGTPNAVITVVRTGNPATPLTVTFTASPVTAVPGQDFSPVSGTLSFVANTPSRTFNVPILDNSLVDGNRTVLLTLGTPAGDAVLGPQAAAALTILDNEQGGAVKLSSAAYSVNEGAASVVVTIRRTGTSLGGNVSVSYTTGNGSALSGLDYTARAGVLSFNAGETSKTVSIPILNDTLAEGGETFTFTLGDPTGGASLVAPSAATITILDNDAASVLRFSSATYTVNEAAGSVTLTVLRSPSTSSGVTVDFATADGSAGSSSDIGALDDFTATTGTLTFGAGNASATIVVPIAQDTRAEGNEAFTVVLGNARGGATLASPAVATVTIVDDEPAIQFSAGGYVGKEGTPSVITILRSGPLTTPATVTFTAAPGTAVAGLDFTPVSTLVSFTAGQSSRTVSVPVLNNALVQGNRTVLLGLNGPTGGAQLGTRAGALLTIPEDDQGGVIKLSAAAYTVAETAASLVVTIVRTGTSLAGNVSVSYATGNGSALSGLDYTARAGVLSFNAGQTSRTVSIPILNDTLVEPAETFTFTLGDPTGGASLGVPAAATITIKSEDAGGVVKLGAATYRVTEGAGNASITVVRTGGTASAVTVGYATANGTATAGADYLPTAGTLTFAANQLNATIAVPILQDLLAEGNETFTVTLSDPQGGATLAAPFAATVTIVDDESAIQFSAGTYAGREGTPAVVTILRSGALVTPATVTFTATPGGAVPGLDFTPVSTVVSFPAGLASKAVSVPILNNTLVQGNRTIMLGLSGPTGGAQLGTRAAAVLTIGEDDQGGVIKLSAASYTVGEGAASVLVTITRTGTSLGSNVSVSYATGNGSALAGLDYTGAAGSVSFNAGETSKTVGIPVLQDTEVESGETFAFMLSNPTGGAALGTPSAATITIKDDDVGSRVSLSAGSYRVLEGAGNLSVTVVRSVSLFRTITVDYATSSPGGGGATAGGDYGETAGTITFLPNQTTAFITIPIVQDSAPEGAETFTLTLSNAQGGARIEPLSSATGTILDDEAVVQFSLNFVGNTPEVVRTGSLASQVTVDYFTTNGTAVGGEDFTPIAGTLTFPAGAASRFIPLVITPDVLAEGPETLTMTLANPAPEGTLSLGPLSSQTWTITDNDFGGSVQFGAATVTASPGESRTIPIVRTGGRGTILTVDWQAISGTSSEAFSPTSGSVTFGPNDTSKGFTITVADFEPTGADITAVFALSVPPGAATIGATNTSTLTIFGSRSTVDLPRSVYSVVEGGGPAVVSVVRGGNLDRQVSVAYATSNDTALATRDYTATAGRLTFAPGQEVAAFKVPIISNGPSGETRSLDITLSSPSPNTFIGEGQNARLQIREASVFTYRLIADDTETIVGFGGVPSLNDAGTVAFKAFTNDDDTRVLAGNGGELATIASQIADELLGIDGVRFPIDAAGNVVFLATAGNERRAILRGSGGALTSLMQTSDTYPDLFDPSVSPNGTVAFGAAQAGDQGPAIFTGPGGVGVSLLVASGDEVFQQVGGRPGVNDDGTVAFVGNRDAGGTRGIFLANPNNGGLPAIATGIDTDTFANVSLNGAGQAAFISALPDPDGQGILIARDGSAVSTLVTAANGFQLFGQPEDDTSPVINALGDVAYLALTLETSGILTGPDPVANMVVREGDPLFDSNVAFLKFGGFNAAGQIAFLAQLLDGRQVVVVGTPAATGQADLGITKTVDASSPEVGADVAFTVTVTNNGPAGATGVRVIDQLPGGYTFQSAAPSQGSYDSATGIWNVGSLAATGPNRTATLQITGTVRATGTYDNTATITASNPTDPVAGNDTASATVTPLLQADIAVTKSVDNATPLLGSNVVFTITATNSGPVAATGVQVTDQLPTGYTFVSATPAPGTYTSASGVWAVGSLAASGAGSSAMLEITATVRATGVYDNTAARTASSPADPNAANNTATVTVTPTTGIALTTQGPLVGVGRTITGAVTLPSPAPAGGVSVTMAANPGGIVTVTPSQVVIPAGTTGGTFTVLGVAVGGTTISGSAAGFVAGNASVTVTSSVISLGALPTVGLGQSASLPINLSTPAPAGGVTVSFASTNTSVVTVTPSVFIAQGAQVPAANPQVTGVNIGTAQVNATAIGFAPDTRVGSVSVNVTFTPTTLNVVTGSTSGITVNISAPAPGGGLTLDLATANASVATVVSPVTVQAGQTSVQAAVTGGAVAQTTLQASGAGVTSGIATINVTQPPQINFGNQTLGKNLQVQNGLSLGATAPAGGVQVTLVSADAGKLLLSTSGTVQGSGQITITIAAGATSSSTPVFLQALDGTGAVTVTVSAPGYTTRVATVTLAPSGFVFNPFQIGNFTTNTLAGNTTLQILPSFLNAATLAFAGNQALRGGLTPVSVTVTAADVTGGPGVGTIAGSPVVFNGGDTVKSAAFDPAATGTSQLQVVPPTGFSTPSNTRVITATVTAPAITLSNQLIGRDLQVSANVFLGAPAPAGGVQVTLASGDATKILLSTSGTAPGSGEITLPVAQGGTATAAFFVQALDGTGSTTLTASAPGFAAQVATMTLGPSGFVFNPFQISNFTTTTLSANTSMQITSALLNPTAGASLFNWATNQAVRGGLTPVSVTVTATDLSGGPGVGAIVGSPVVFNAGDSVKTLAFDPAAAGTSQLQVVPPAGFTTPNSARVITATVNAPALTFSSQTIGKDLQTSGNVFLGAAAPAGGVRVTLASDDASKLLLSTSAATQGSGQLTLDVGQGGTATGAIFFQSLDSTGSVTVTASAPGYASQAGTMTLAPSGFVFNPFATGNFSTTTFAGNTTVQVVPAQLNSATRAFAAIQALRGGITPVSVAVTATDLSGGPGVGTIVGSPVGFGGGESFENLQFNPAATGVSLLEVVPPAGFATPSNARAVAATVTAPVITLSLANVRVGRDLQQQVFVSLGATPPGAVTVTVTVASTAVATLVPSTNAAVAGGATVTFTDVTSTSAGSFFVQGRTSTGTTSVTAQAPGYADGTATVTTQPSGFTLGNSNFTTTVSAGNSNLQIESARLDPTTLNFEASQPVRGGAAVSVPVAATDLTGGPGVGTITTSPVSIGNNASTATTQFNPAAAGTSSVTVGVPAGFSTPSNRRQITVTVNP